MNAPKTAQKKRGPKRSREPVSPLARDVGMALEKLRAGKPLEELANELGTSHQALSLMESGQIDPESPKARSTFVALAKHFQHNLGLAWLSSYVSLTHAERKIVARLARESGRSFHEQLFALVSRQLVHHKESAA